MEVGSILWLSGLVFVHYKIPSEVPRCNLGNLLEAGYSVTVSGVEKLSKIHTAVINVTSL